MSEKVEVLEDKTKANEKFDWKLTRDLMKGKWKYLVIALFATAISAITSAVTPLITSTTLDSIIGSKAFNDGGVSTIVGILGGASFLLENLWICGILIVIFSAIGGVSSYFRGKSTATAGELLSEELKNRLYIHIQNLSYDFHKHAETGDLLHRSSADVNTVRNFFGNQLVELVRIIMISIVGIFMMSRINMNVTIYSVIAIPIILVFSMLFYKKVQKVYQELEKVDSQLSVTIQESMSGVRVVRAFGQQKQEIDKFDNINENLSKEIVRINFFQGIFWGGTDIIIFSTYAIVLIISTMYIVNGTLSIGEGTALLSYMGLFLWPIRQLGRIIADFSKAKVAMGRISDILSKETEPLEGLSLDEPLKGDIVFDDVTFRYGDGITDVIKNISFTAKQGQTIAILGSTGSGKSTLMYLLQRLYDYDSGKITVNNQEITEFNRRWLRENIGIVLQEPFLYSRSIKENIAITRPWADEKEVMNVSHIAAISDMFGEFEKGYDTEVGERGVTLSGGQKQRVAIARTLMQNTPIIIFDDSLSALDSETDKLIRDRLKETNSDTTKFIISHRINTLADADLILVMEDGEIIQRGIHEQLINEEGLYKRVWGIQGAQGQEFNEDFSTKGGSD